jgi:hypothetical protein
MLPKLLKNFWAQVILPLKTSQVVGSPCPASTATLFILHKWVGVTYITLLLKTIQWFPTILKTKCKLILMTWPLHIFLTSTHCTILSLLVLLPQQAYTHTVNSFSDPCCFLRNISYFLLFYAEPGTKDTRCLFTDWMSEQVRQQTSLENQFSM